MDSFAAQAMRAWFDVSDAAVHRLVRCPLWVRTMPLATGEVCYAVYENHPGSPDESAVATSLGLYIRRPAGWEFIAYRHIEAVALGGERTGTAVLTLRLRSGRIASIPVRGGYERGREATRLRELIEAIRCVVSRDPGPVAAQPRHTSTGGDAAPPWSESPASTASRRLIAAARTAPGGQ